MPSFRLILVTFMLIPAMALATTATGAAPTASGDWDEHQARLLGALTETHLALRLDRTPARTAFKGLAEALNIPITVRYRDELLADGIDPETPVTLAVDRASGLLVLELILEQCALYEPCSWQLRRGFVEVGTKERLSAPAAAVQRVYKVTDLLLEPPYFSTLVPGSTEGFDDHQYRSAALSEPGPRKSLARALQEVIRAIVETIEPGNWDYGQFGVLRLQDQWTEGGAAGPGAMPQRARPRRIARLRVVPGGLLIAAPDFMHRQVAGYAAPIAPDPLTADQRRRRSEAASSTRARFEILAPEAPDPASSRPAPRVAPWLGGGP